MGREDLIGHVQDALKYLLSEPSRPKLDGRAFPWMAYFSDSQRVDDFLLLDAREPAKVTVDLRMLPLADRLPLEPRSPARASASFPSSSPAFSLLRSAPMSCCSFSSRSFRHRHSSTSRTSSAFSRSTRASTSLRATEWIAKLDRTRGLPRRPGMFASANRATHARHVGISPFPRHGRTRERGFARGELARKRRGSGSTAHDGRDRPRDRFQRLMGARVAADELETICPIRSPSSWLPSGLRWQQGSM